MSSPAYNNPLPFGTYLYDLIGKSRIIIKIIIDGLYNTTSIHWNSRGINDSRIVHSRFSLHESGNIGFELYGHLTGCERRAMETYAEYNHRGKGFSTLLMNTTIQLMKQQIKNREYFYPPAIQEKCYEPTESDWEKQKQEESHKGRIHFYKKFGFKIWKNNGFDYISADIDDLRYVTDTKVLDEFDCFIPLTHFLYISEDRNIKEPRDAFRFSFYG